MLRVGTFLGNRYEIKSRIGAGGMSDVYKAMDLKLNRLVAIKVLKDEFSQEPNFVSKFRKEAQNAAGLSHPNIVGVYDVGEDRGIHYIVMELIEGITLKKYIERKKKLEIRESIEVAMQVARGIEAAHAQGIIHRDIKPQNIMISREGKVKVTDFGIARATHGQTISANTMGSVHYISPEQARGGYCDERSDIYSLGITLYEMLTGRVPFEGDTTVAVALLHIQGDMVPPRQYEPLIPVSLEKIILKCTQKKPELRYSSATELITDLKKALTAPNEDFVRIANLKSDSPTVIITEGEREQIQRQRVLTREENSSLKNRPDHERRNERKPYDRNTDDEDPFDDSYTGSSLVEKVITAIIVVVAVGIVGVVAVLVISGIRNNPAEQTEMETSTMAVTETAETQTAGETVEQVEMRNLLGMPKDQAIQLLDSQGLKYILEEGSSDVYEEGLVFEQEYKAGDMLPVNTVVILKVSTGVGEILVPQTIIGLTESEARTALRRLGLNVAENTRTEASGNVAEGLVSGTDPAAGTSVKKGTTITLIISGSVQAAEETTTAAPATEASVATVQVSVPDLSNYSLADAANALTNLGLVVGEVTEEYSRDDQAGKVISQSLSGQSVDKGTVINLVIGKGEELMPVDDPTLVFEDSGDPDYDPGDEVIVVPGVDEDDD